MSEREERPCTEEPTRYGQVRSAQTRERNTRRGPMLRGTARGRQKAALPGRAGRAVPAAPGRKIPAGPALPRVTGKEKEKLCEAKAGGGLSSAEGQGKRGTGW